MFEVRMTCYEFGKKEPYIDVMAIEFDTYEMAELAMYKSIVDELNTLNGISSDGTFSERRFTVQHEESGYDARIICWDGEDYSTVTEYNIIKH